MEQHKKNEQSDDIPKRLWEIKKRLKQVFVLVGILIITLSLSGCEKLVENDVSAETQFQTSSMESTKVDEKIIKQDYESFETTILRTFSPKAPDIDIELSRKYEFDLEDYIENHDLNNIYSSLKEEVSFLTDEQYETYAKAWIFIDNIEYFIIPTTITDKTLNHFCDKNGEVCDSFYNNVTKEYAYVYISSYKSFYEYLQSVFTQEAVDKIMADKRFLTIGNNLYFKFGEKGGAIYFRGGQYQLIEKNDNEVKFEYLSQYKNDIKEWTKVHQIKLVNTKDGWRAELFEHLKIEY